LGGFLVGTAGSIFFSIFLGKTIKGRYGMYTFLITALAWIVSTFTVSPYVGLLALYKEDLVPMMEGVSISGRPFSTAVWQLAKWGWITMPGIPLMFAIAGGLIVAAMFGFFALLDELCQL
jgi:hypothetical protein